MGERFSSTLVVGEWVMMLAGCRADGEWPTVLYAHVADTIPQGDAFPTAQFCYQKLVGARGFEPPTPWSRTNKKDSGP